MATQHTRDPKAEADEIADSASRILIARKSILDDLRRRYREGDKAVRPNRQWDDRDQNCFSGSGEMPCPVCRQGVLSYFRAASNGHVHAQCTVPTCVRWME